MSRRIHHGASGPASPQGSSYLLLNRCLQRMQTGLNLYRVANELACHRIGEEVLAAGLAQKGRGE